MHARMMGWAMAGTLAWFPLSARPAAAQDSGQAESADPAYGRVRLGELIGEGIELRARIVEADRLLEQVAAGAMLVSTGMGMRAMARDRIVEWATEQIYREGTGIGGSLGQQEVLRRVQQWAAIGTRLAAALRQARSADMTREQAVVAEIDRENAAAIAAIRGRERAAASACGFPRRWRIDMPGRGSTEIAADASGNVTGAFFTTASARRAFNQLTITWFARSGGYEIAGRYIVTLDGQCGGSGELVFDVVPSGASDLGIRGGPVTFTSVGS